MIDSRLREELSADDRRLSVDPRTIPARIHHLRAAGRSGAHCLHSFSTDDDDDDTVSTKLGTGVHSLLLGQPVVVWDQESDASIKRRDKAAKIGAPDPGITKAPRSGSQWEEFREKNPRALILNRSEHDSARRIVDAIMACGPASRLITAPGVIVERTILWDQEGRRRRSTPDLRRSADAWGPSFNCEIKTTRDASPHRFGVDCERMSYHAQLADQSAAIMAETGRAPSATYIICVETSRPHVAQVYEVPPTILERGAKLCSQWLSRLQLYEATDQWGGYSPRIEELEFPTRYIDE